VDIVEAGDQGNHSLPLHFRVGGHGYPMVEAVAHQELGLGVKVDDEEACLLWRGSTRRPEEHWQAQATSLGLAMGTASRRDRVESRSSGRCWWRL
jgi:hypothetical protein